ncbi:MAG TPA: HAMP domain-containing sensor histidine kinase, partial [Candidatus Udaeobacter sp.]|nr:HAMP domain-containing sensor histidine kinase [Candidatus Udaeobacter sp.]
HDLRIVTLSGIWLALLFLVGAFLLAAYRTPVGRSPAGLLLMSLMAVFLTLAGLLEAFGIALTHTLPPWWADAVYDIGILIGLEAPRFDRVIDLHSKEVQTEASWSTARTVIPYVGFVPLMILTFVASIVSTMSDFMKSLITTAVVVSSLVGLRQLLQVMDNHRLIRESLAMLEVSRRNEAKVAQLSKAKSEVMSNLSHEFRNALVGIAGFSEMMRDQDLTPDEVKTFAADINSDAERLTRMINELLDLDRMEAGRVKLELKVVDINAKIAEAVERAEVASGKCHIVSKLDARLQPVMADADRLFQVISNLLSNAIKYSPEGGEVQVSTELEGDEVRVTVKDWGVGIAAEDVPRLFQRYERVGGEHKISGTGLGLVIARQIVEMHGGKIWAQSTLGRGSEFAFTIPARVASGPPSAAQRAA